MLRLTADMLRKQNVNGRAGGKAQKYYASLLTMLFYSIQTSIQRAFERLKSWPNFAGTHTHTYPILKWILYKEVFLWYIWVPPAEHVSKDVCPYQTFKNKIYPCTYQTRRLEESVPRPFHPYTEVQPGLCETSPAVSSGTALTQGMPPSAVWSGTTQTQIYHCSNN